MKNRIIKVIFSFVDLFYGNVFIYLFIFYFVVKQVINERYIIKQLPSTNFNSFNFI